MKRFVVMLAVLLTFAMCFAMTDSAQAQCGRKFVVSNGFQSFSQPVFFNQGFGQQAFFTQPQFFSQPVVAFNQPAFFAQPVVRQRVVVRRGLLPLRRQAVIVGGHGAAIVAPRARIVLR